MIETERLVLRSLQDSDLATLVVELNNFNITRNTARIPYPYSEQDAEDYLTYKRSLNSQSLALAISLSAAPAKLIGGISYLYSQEKNDAELGYWLSEHHWRKGLMTEATLALVKHAFNTPHIERLVACYHNDNPVSAKILTRLGFEGDVQCSNFSLAQGRLVAVTNMHLTKARWLAKQKGRS